MSTDEAVARFLSSIEELTDHLAAELLGCSPTGWVGPTNCPPWRVCDLAVHVVTSGENMSASIRQGLAGSVDPIVVTGEQLSRHAALKSADPSTVAGALRAGTVEFVGLYEGLSGSALSTICYHRRGNRSIRWCATHRLAELAFHAWDLQLSLGQEPSMDDRVAALLLPTLLESNAPRTYAAGLMAQPGNGERYVVAVAGDPSARWLVTVAPDLLKVRRGGAGADVTITGSASTLALLVYGRRELLDLHRTGQLSLDGDLGTAERFSMIFPRP